MVGGGSDLNQAANRLGLPAEIILESEGFVHSGDEVYPDNFPTVAIFSDMLTQWRTGPAGVVGLDYKALKFVFKMRNTPEIDREYIFDGIRIMERAAIRSIREGNS